MPNSNLSNVDRLIAMNMVTELRTVDLKDDESRLTIQYIDDLITKYPHINRRINKLGIVTMPQKRLDKLNDYLDKEKV